MIQHTTQKETRNKSCGRCTWVLLWANDTHLTQQLGTIEMRCETAAAVAARNDATHPGIKCSTESKSDTTPNVDQETLW
jgi:hypothetical protein